MAERTERGRFAPGASGNPGGMTAEERHARTRANELLLNTSMDEVWLRSYRSALEAGVAPVILDYTYRRLGKPKDAVELEEATRDVLLSLLARLTAEERTAQIDALKEPTKQ